MALAPNDKRSAGCDAHKNRMLAEEFDLITSAAI